MEKTWKKEHLKNILGLYIPDKHQFFTLMI